MLLRKNDGIADSIFPFSGRCGFVDFETESQGTQVAVLILHNNKAALLTLVLFWQRSSLFLESEVNKRNDPEFATLLSRLQGDVNALPSHPGLIFRQKGAELSLRTCPVKDNKGSGLRPVSHRHRLRLGPGRVLSKQPQALPRRATSGPPVCPLQDAMESSDRHIPWDFLVQEPLFYNICGFFVFISWLHKDRRMS